MNKIFSSAFAAVMVLAATSSLAQGANAATMGKGYGITNNSGGGVTTPSGAVRTSLARLPMHSPTAHEYNKPIFNGASRSNDRGFVQRTYGIRAIVVPINGASDARGERTLKVTAPTKSGAMSRLRQKMDAIGVPVRIVYIEMSEL